MRARTVASRARCAVLAAVVVALGCGAPETPPFRPLADTKLLMHAVVEPQAEVIWDSVQTIVTEQGTQEIRPQSDQEWESVRNSAVTLAESGNLLMMSPRAREGDWMQAAAALIDTSAAAMQAAEARDADRLFEVGGEIYVTCTACHQKFPPAPTPAPGETAL